MNQEKHTPALQKFYFTYGSSECYPFRGGWTLICAPDIKAAQQIFKAYHPNKDGVDGCLNCADFYTEAQFKEQDFRDGNYGAFCHEVICAWPTEAGALEASAAQDLAELADLAHLNSLCHQCAYDECAYSNRGTCRFAMVFGEKPPYTQRHGYKVCLGFAEKPESEME